MHINKHVNKYKKFAPVVLRFALVFVFAWFSINQLRDQSMWVRLIPSWTTSLSGMDAVTIVKMNGVFEMIMLILFAIGYRIRIVAGLLTLHLLMIVSNIGLNPTGVRDIGLMFAMLSVFLHGADMYSYDKEEGIFNLN